MRKLILFTNLLFVTQIILLMISCEKNPTFDLKAQKIGYLKNKSGGWSGTVTVPIGTATQSSV